MADISLPKTKRRTAMVSVLTMLTQAALLLSLAGSPLVQAASGEKAAEYDRSGNANASPSDEGATSPAMGDATNSVDLAADIARAAASGTLSNAVDPRVNTLGIAHSQRNASDEFKAGGN